MIELLHSSVFPGKGTMQNSWSASLMGYSGENIPGHYRQQEITSSNWVIAHFWSKVDKETTTVLQWRARVQTPAPFPILLSRVSWNTPHKPYCPRGRLQSLSHFLLKECGPIESNPAPQYRFTMPVLGWEFTPQHGASHKQCPLPSLS